jgi:hypothetical protein
MRYVTSILLFASCAWAWQGGAVVGAPSSQYKLMRSVSGSKSAQTKAGFHINDPRSTFYLPEDTKVIVYMEWEGSPGKHNFEAYWRNPAGKVAVVSDFAYETRPPERRYSGYMQLIMNPEMPTGLWSMEARIDGEVLGTHTFEVISSTKPAIKEDTRMALSVGDVYARASTASATVEALDASGKPLRSSLGFALDDDSFVTAFQAIDGATSVRVHFRDGTSVEVKEVKAFDRWQDWAVLPVRSQSRLERAPATMGVGDKAMTLNVDESGNRSIVDASLIGNASAGKSGVRFKMTSSLSNQSVGGPVINEYGEAVGLVAGLAMPGIKNVAAGERGFFLYATNLFNSPLNANNNETVVPIERIPTNFKAPTALAELAANGTFTPTVIPRVSIGRGSVCKSLTKNGLTMPVDEKFSFSSAEPMMVYVLWQPAKKDKAMLAFKVYDSENRLRVESPAKKANFDANSPLTSTWNLPVNALPPDTYRVDVTLDGVPAWRSYFRVTP